MKNNSVPLGVFEPEDVDACASEDATSDSSLTERNVGLSSDVGSTSSGEEMTDESTEEVATAFLPIYFSLPLPLLPLLPHR